jgi:hypothetical protein
MTVLAISNGVFAVLFLYVLHLLFRERAEAWRRHVEDAARHREEVERLVLQLQARSPGEFVGAVAALQTDPLASPPPDGWWSDDTGLILEPFWNHERAGD